MNIQHQVSTMEQSEKLKTLGVSQDTMFSWCGDKAHIPTEHNPDDKAWVWIGSTIPANNQEADHREDVQSAKPFAAAFSVAELLIMLPDKICVRKENRKYEVSGKIEDFPGLADVGTFFFVASDESFAEALAAFLIIGIEKNISGFDVASINQRLNEL